MIRIILNKISSHLALTGLAFSLLMLAPSCDYLGIDDYIDNELSIDTVFQSSRYIEAFMWGTAADFPDEGNIFSSSGGYTPGVMATDEAFCLFGLGEFQGMNWVLGNTSASNLPDFNRWRSYYQIIRNCNTIFSRIDEAKDWTAEDRARVLGMTRFLRAYAYYNLITNYGPPVLVGDEMIDNNEVITYYDRPRALYDEAVEYICTEFEEAAKAMDTKVTSIMDFGLPTKGAAYGLVARLRLIHASDLFNGGVSARMYFGSWIRKSDGANYISQTPHPERWAIAAAACKRVMDMKSDGVPLYKLYTVDADDATPALPTNVSDPDYHKPFPDGAAGIDPLRSYWNIFNGEAVMSINPEFVWGARSPAVRQYTQHVFPYAFGGWGGLAVTQKIVDAYEMADGRTKENASTAYPYSEQGFSGKDSLFSGYRLNAGVYNMYINREPRFYASIGFSEAYWTMNSTSDANYKNKTITYYYDSPNGKTAPPNPVDYPATGYVIRKYVHPMDAWIGNNARRMEKPFPIIRYAEILLSYAEALNNIEGSVNVTIDGATQTFTRDAAEIKRAINQVRYRGGIPGLTDAEVADAKFVMEKIKKERMVEFLYENRRYFDVRRWGDYESSESETIRGMNTDAVKEFFYQRTIPTSTRVANRVVNRRFIFMAIPETELKRVPLLDQNPGW